MQVVIVRTYGSIQKNSSLNAKILVIFHMAHFGSDTFKFCFLNCVFVFFAIPILAIQYLRVDVGVAQMSSRMLSHLNKKHYGNKLRPIRTEFFVQKIRQDKE